MSNSPAHIISQIKRSKPSISYFSASLVESMQSIESKKKGITERFIADSLSPNSSNAIANSSMLIVLRGALSSSKNIKIKRPNPSLERLNTEQWNLEIDKLHSILNEVANKLRATREAREGKVRPILALFASKDGKAQNV